jgi:hypothetical protein
MTKKKSNETKGQPAATEAIAVAQIDDNVGPCPECGSPVIQYSDHFACSNAIDGVCGFTIPTAEIVATVEANILRELHDAIIGSDRENRQFMRALLSSREKQKWTWHEDVDSIYEYYELQLVKNDAGQWVVQLTRDDAELAALAKEGYAQMNEW